jgi:hypothetical protein
MQKFTSSSPITSLHSQTASVGNINHLANPDYVAVSTEMLNTSARERLALEELAACVGISPQAIIALINGSGLNP